MSLHHFGKRDLLTFVVCCFISTSLLLEATARHRTAARRSSCSKNLRQLGLAIHNYHSAFKQLPYGSGGTSTGSVSEPLLGNADRLSPYVVLLPFLEQQETWEQVANPITIKNIEFPRMGPVPWHDPKEYPPWGKRPSVLTCPTDQDSTQFKLAASYTVNYGDAVYNVGAPVDGLKPTYAADFASKRGTFVRQKKLAFRDVLDGLSTTLLLSESRIGGDKVAKGVEGLGMDPSRCVSVRKENDLRFWPDGREARWTDGSLRSIGFQTILPPNSPSATSIKGELEGVMSASSLHPGGVHVLFADGMVQFVSDSIDSGDASMPSVAGDVASGYTQPDSKSPYGVWGALGTRAGRELARRPSQHITDPLPDLTEREIKKLGVKPIQTWRLSESDHSMRAWLVAVVRESHVVLLTEDGDVKSFRLSELHSEDAYQAVRETIERKVADQQAVIETLERGLRLLEQRKYEEFVDKLIVPISKQRARQQLVGRIELSRGMMIHRFDTSLRMLRSLEPMQRSVVIQGGRIKIKGANLELVQVDDQWRIRWGR